jgi:deoxyribodipyrimidine photo-lyase
MPAPILMWFRQDLRLADHPALSAAAAAGEIIPLYVLDDETPGDWRWGGASRWWLHQSLKSLSKDVPLVLRKGRADQVLEQVLIESGASALHFTRDYAPWSPALEQRIKDICDRHGVACHRHSGFLLHEPESITNGSGAFFKVYTPYSRAAFAKGEPRALKPKPKITLAAHALNSDKLDDWKLLPTTPNWASGFEAEWDASEAGAQKLLADFLDDGFARYADGRDRPDQPNTSRLSAALHWGNISPHQVWHATRYKMHEVRGRFDTNGEKFLKEILWREFSYNLVFHVPHFPSQPFRPEFEDFPWNDDAAALSAWQRGETGYPIVDAGMRELWATGIMHNRVRMITASFLVKHLLIPWQQGEAWFWDTLVDADIGSNSASWQWVAGCGADAAPYFRIFNPFLQGEKFDPDGTYVKRWVPELKDVPANYVHQPWTMPLPPKAYPKPIIDHNRGRERALAAFQKLKGSQT